MTDPNPRPWWSRAVFYQVYPKSFCDSSGDGVGDLDGVAAKLDYLEALGVDAIWLNPVMVSPMADNGYDVADPLDVDPLFGGIEALDRLTDEAHRLGMKVTMDLVPNHTSSAHPWFQAALAASAGSDQRERYIFRDGTGPGGVHPPNNWVSIFGGPAWSRIVEPDQLLDNVIELARTIAELAPFGVQLTKRALQVNTDATGLAAALELENRNQVLSHATEEAAARRRRWQ